PFKLGDKRLVVSDRDDRVEVRKAASQLLAFLRNDASSDRDRPAWNLPVLQLVKLRVDAVLGRLPDHARVEDRDVSALERILDVARRQHTSGETFGICRVHLASNRPDVKRPCTGPRQRLSTSNRMPVRSSPSIEMSINAGMQTRSRPPGAT